MKNFNISVIIFMVLVLVSCEQDIELDLKQSKELVLLGAVSPQETLEIVLGTSSISSSDPVTYPENAKVTVFEDGIEIGDMEFTPSSNDNIPKYRLNYIFQAEKEYSIVAVEDNFKTISSSTTVPSFPVRTRSTLDFLYPFAEDQSFLYFSGKLQLEVIGDMKEGEFYHVKMSRDVITRKGNTEDGFVRDTIRGNLLFLFNRNLDAQQMTHETGILITSETILSNPDVLTFDFQLAFNKTELDRGKIYLELRKASSEYYNFHQSVTDQDAKNLRNGLLSPKPSNIFNNIENGLGNFGSYNKRENAIEW